MNDRTLEKALNRTYPAFFLLILSTSLNYILDTAFAWMFVSMEAVAAVGVVMPIVFLFNSIVEAFVSGCSIHYSQVLGRGRHARAQEVYTTGVYCTTIASIIFCVLSNVFAVRLVKLFGAADAAVVSQAVLYLRIVSFSVLTTAISELVIRGLSMYGLNKASLIACSVRLLGNVGLSLLFVLVLPFELKIMGLALGTIFSAVIGTFIAIFLKEQSGYGLTVVRYRPRPIELKAMFRDGFSSSIDYLMGAVAGAFMNNIIGASELGTTGIALYSAVNSVYSLALCPSQAMQMTNTPLFGMLHGAEDKKALKRSFLVCLRRALVYSFIFCIILLFLMLFVVRPSVLTAQRVTEEAFNDGVIISFIAVLPTAVIYAFANLFELTDRTKEALAAEIIPDSVFMVMLTALFLKMGLGLSSVWISYSLSGILFIIIYIIHTKIRYKELNVSNLMRLEEWETDVEQNIDVSIRNRNTDIARLTKTVQDFLNKGDASKRIAYMTALCMDELASDIVAHSQYSSDSVNAIMDVKLLSLSDEFRIIIRNMDKSYNPLDFELDTETFAKVGVMMAQRLAKKISYQYLYNMNIVTIYIKK